MSGYMSSGDCPVNWIVCPPCDGIQDALADTDYIMANIDDAPWVDQQEPATKRFYGAHTLSIEGLMDSTREASISEGITDGGVVGQVRHAVRQFRVRAILSAQGEDALESGLAWLKAALDPDSCGLHGASCGAVDACFFIACPRERGPNEAQDVYQDEIDILIRNLHNVTCISGPLIEQKLHREPMWGYIVEFTLAAATPWIFGLTEEVVIPPSLPVVIQDVPFNLVPYPSAELGAGNVVVSRNYSDNPSVETNLTNWAKGTAVVVATDAVLTQSDTASGGLASAGTKSARVRFTATNSGTAGVITAENTSSTFAATVAGQRMSVNMWSTAQVVSGTAVIQKVEIVAIWRAGTTVLRTDVIGVVPAVGGGAISQKSVAVPVGATNVIMQAKATLTSWSTGAVVDLYADAVAVTVP